MGSNPDRYTQDFYAWTQEQAALLRESKVHDLDLTNLAEEIESLGRSDQRALSSHLSNLVMHLLKWQYQPQGRQVGHSWATSIHNGRDEIALLVKNSSSLRPHRAPLLARRYAMSRRTAAQETGLPLATFPDTCPWTVEQLLDENFFPEP
jgi:hypothetical protein